MTIEEYKAEIIRMISEMNFDFIKSVYWFTKGMSSAKKGGNKMLPKDKIVGNPNSEKGGVPA